MKSHDRKKQIFQNCKNFFSAGNNVERLRLYSYYIESVLPGTLKSVGAENSLSHKHVSFTTLGRRTLCLCIHL